MAFSADVTTSAAAPSLTPGALPAVTVPSSLNAGLSFANPSAVVSGRIGSSCATMSASPFRWGSVIGTISSRNHPASVAAAARRLDPSVPNYFTDTFDALEVWIGDNRSQVYTNFLGRSAGDWFNLLNQGYRRTAVANSDTHRRTTAQAGVPRTFVASPTDAPYADRPVHRPPQPRSGPPTAEMSAR